MIHRFHYQHKIWSLRMKKIKDNICWSSEMSARDNFPKMVEVSKNLKHCISCCEFQCPKLISLALLNVEFYKCG